MSIKELCIVLAGIALVFSSLAVSTGFAIKIAKSAYQPTAECAK